MRPSMKVSGIVAAILLLESGALQRGIAQSGGGLSSLFGDLFSGPKADAPAQLPGVGADHVQSALAGDQRGGGRVFQGQRLIAERSQYPGVASASRADVKGSTWCGETARLLGEQAPAFPVPPVPVLNLNKCSEFGGFHSR